MILKLFLLEDGRFPVNLSTGGVPGKDQGQKLCRKCSTQLGLSTVLSPLWGWDVAGFVIIARQFQL